MEEWNRHRYWIFSYIWRLRICTGVLEFSNHHHNGPHEGIPRTLEELRRGKDKRKAQGESNYEEDERSHYLQRGQFDFSSFLDVITKFTLRKFFVTVVNMRL